ARIHPCGVAPEGGAPAPPDVACSARRARLSHTPHTLAPAPGTSSKRRDGCSPWARLPTEPANRSAWARCPSLLLGRLVPADETGKGTGLVAIQPCQSAARPAVATGRACGGLLPSGGRGHPVRGHTTSI